MKPGCCGVPVVVVIVICVGAVASTGISIYGCAGVRSTVVSDHEGDVKVPKARTSSRSAGALRRN